MGDKMKLSRTIAVETSASQYSDSLVMIFHTDQVIYLILSLLCTLGSLRCQEESSNQLLQHIRREHLVMCHWGEKAYFLSKYIFSPLIYFTSWGKQALSKNKINWKFGPLCYECDPKANILFPSHVVITISLLWIFMAFQPFWRIFLLSLRWQLKRWKWLDILLSIRLVASK